MEKIKGASKKVMCTKMQKKRDRDMWRKGHSEIMRKGCKEGCNTKERKIGHPKCKDWELAVEYMPLHFLFLFIDDWLGRQSWNCLCTF